MSAPMHGGCRRLAPEAPLVLLVLPVPPVAPVAASGR